VSTLEEVKNLKKFCINSDADVMDDEIRQIIAEHGRIPGDVGSLEREADLYAAGMTSHASVNLMLALEDHFDVEFPDRMLTRNVFASIAAISAALTELRAEAKVP
jgi:acyl carrier protein